MKNQPQPTSPGIEAVSGECAPGPEVAEPTGGVSEVPDGVCPECSREATRATIPFRNRFQVERDAITACAKRFDGFRFFKKAGAGSHPDSSAIQRAAETGSAFAERDKDFGLFFGLWHHLFNCEGVYLPQTDVAWTALRRLFLNLCEVTVPDPYRCDVSRSYSGESLESAPLCEAAWGEKFVSILPQLKACVEERLQLYDGLTFEKLREMVVREDPISIGPEAGVLYEVYQLF